MHSHLCIQQIYFEPQGCTWFIESIVWLELRKCIRSIRRVKVGKGRLGLGDMEYGLLFKHLYITLVNTFGSYLK